MVRLKYIIQLLAIFSVCLYILFVLVHLWNMVYLLDSSWTRPTLFAAMLYSSILINYYNVGYSTAVAEFMDEGIAMSDYLETEGHIIPYLRSLLEFGDWKKNFFRKALAFYKANLYRRWHIYIKNVHKSYIQPKRYVTKLYKTTRKRVCKFLNRSIRWLV